MDFLLNYLLFFAKLLTFLIGFIIFISFIMSQKKRNSSTEGEWEIIDLSLSHEENIKQLKHQLIDENIAKLNEKIEKKQKKEEEKQKKKKIKNLKNKNQILNEEDLQEKKDKIFVIDFYGSVDAHEVETLREEITAIISIAEPNDFVLCRLESGGGMVHGYGLATSQLKRLIDANIKLVVSVDKIAASGGYMMASIANQIIAAPFAVLGSIGVIAQIPNFNKVLKKQGVDFEMHTAGEYKRTITMFGENTEKERAKFKEELEETHNLFKDLVKNSRKQLDIEKVATGEHWYGTQALKLSLVDKIQTSDDFIMEHYKTHQILQLNYSMKKTFKEKILKELMQKTIFFIQNLTKNRRFF